MTATPDNALFADSLYPQWKPPELPDWITKFGMKRDGAVLNRWALARDHVRQVEADGIGHVGPMLLLHARDVSGSRAMIGKALWKNIHNSTVYVNAHRMRLVLSFSMPLDQVMQFPAGNLRGAIKVAQYWNGEHLPYAARNATKEIPVREVTTLLRDHLRMGGDFNPDWSINRLRKEHDRRVVEQKVHGASDVPWADPWEFETKGYRFELLRSNRDFAVESAQQRHCVQSYASAAFSGREIVMRITGKERATCSWRTHRYDRHIQVKTFANGSPSKACREAAFRCRKVFEERERK